LIQDGTIPLKKFAVDPNETWPSQVSIAKISGPGTLNYSLLPTINNDKISSIDVSKISGPGTLNYNLIPTINNDKISSIDGSKVSGMLKTEVIPTITSDKIQNLTVNKITGPGKLDFAFLPENIEGKNIKDNSLAGTKIIDGTISSAKLANGAIDLSKTTGKLDVSKVDGMGRLILDGWYKDRFTFTNGIDVNGGAWGRTRDGKEPSTFSGEVAILNGNNTWTHFNHKNTTVNLIRGDTTIDGPLTVYGGLKVCNPRSRGQCKTIEWV
jgi:hypothetical protein